MISKALENLSIYLINYFKFRIKNNHYTNKSYRILKITKVQKFKILMIIMKDNNNKNNKNMNILLIII